MRVPASLYVRPSGIDGTDAPDLFPWYPDEEDRASVLTLSFRYTLPTMFHTGALRSDWQAHANVVPALARDSGPWTCRCRNRAFSGNSTLLTCVPLNRCDDCLQRLEHLTESYGNWNLLVAATAHTHSLAFLHTGVAQDRGCGTAAGQPSTARLLAQRRVAWTAKRLNEELTFDNRADASLTDYALQILHASDGIGAEPVPIGTLAQLASVDRTDMYLTWIDALLDGAERRQADAASTWITTWYPNDAMTGGTPDAVTASADTPDVYAALTSPEAARVGSDRIASHLGWIVTGDDGAPTSGQPRRLGAPGKAYFFTCNSNLARGLQAATRWRSDVRIHPLTGRQDGAAPSVCSLAQRLQHAAGWKSWIQAVDDALVAAELLDGASNDTVTVALELARDWRNTGRALAETAASICNERLPSAEGPTQSRRP